MRKMPHRNLEATVTPAADTEPISTALPPNVVPLHLVTELPAPDVGKIQVAVFTVEPGWRIVQARVPEMYLEDAIAALEGLAL
jgi:hypothetical protein